MTFEAFIKELNDAGWRLGNLSQLAGTEWYTCLFDDEGYCHTATGDTPVDAMAIALHRPRTSRPPTTQTETAMRVLVITIAGPERFYEDTYPVDTPFTFGHDKLIVGPASDNRIGHYNMPFVISVTAEDREPTEAGAEGRMLGDIP